MNKNLKDSKNSTSISVMDISFSISYTKTHKLITALYMVTDIIDKDEPIRNRLRILGTEIISDMHSTPAKASNKIAETVSFLNIASAMNLISEMNCSILKKEFLELKGSIQEYINLKPNWFSEFSFQNARKQSKGHIENINGHQLRTRIGVQKGSTLMQALSDNLLDFGRPTSERDKFQEQKKQRRDSITNIIKNNGGSANITDIKTKTIVQGSALNNVSEKTLQRELMSMTKDGVLNKTGEKRWSRYFIKVLGS